MNPAVLGALSWSALPIVADSLFAAAWLTLRHRSRPPWGRIHRLAQLAWTAQAGGSAAYLVGAPQAGLVPGRALWLTGLALIIGYSVFTFRRLDPEQRRTYSTRTAGSRWPAIPAALEGRFALAALDAVVILLVGVGSYGLFRWLAHRLPVHLSLLGDAANGFLYLPVAALVLLPCVALVSYFGATRPAPRGTRQ